ncbi:MAG TPA: hypothetical protein VGE06_06255, partial [Flavisolibacter sp.]
MPIFIRIALLFMAMYFNVTFCNPFQKDIINLGLLSKEAILSHFEAVDGMDYLAQMSGAKKEDIYFSPSLGIEASDGKSSLSISAVGEPRDHEFYIFYQRPKFVKTASGE